MSKKLHLSSKLSLPGNVVAETFAFLAKRGAGKTYAAMVLAEEMLEAKAQIVVLDPVAKWWGLRLSADGKTPAFDIPVFGGRHGDLPLSPRSGKVIATLVAVRRVSVVLDISLFMSDSERRQFVTDFARELYRLKTQQDDPSPLHVFLEEAEEFAPQDYEGGDAPMIGAIKKLCKLGRNVGIGVSLISQRSADVNKKALSQTEYMVALRTRAPQDLAAIRGWIEHAGSVEDTKAVLASLPTLAIGDAYVFGGDFAEKVTIRRKATLDTSKTPEGGTGKKRYEPEKLSEKDIDRLKDAMEESIVEAEAQDPRKLKQRISFLESEVKRLTNVVQVPPAKVIEKSMLSAQDKKLLERSFEQAHNIVDQLSQRLQTLVSVYGSLVAQLKKQDEIKIPIPDGRYTVVAKRLEPNQFYQLPDQAKVNGKTVKAGEELRQYVRGESEIDTGEVKLARGARAMLYALRATKNGGWMTRQKIAALATMVATSGTFGDYLSKLRSAKLIEESDYGIRLSAQGAHAIRKAIDDPMPSAAEIVEAWRQKGGMPRGARAMFDVLVKAGSEGLSREDLGKQSGLASSSGTFGDYLSKLRVKGLLDERDRGIVRLHEDFLS